MSRTRSAPSRCARAAVMDATSGPPRGLLGTFSEPSRNLPLQDACAAEGVTAKVIGIDKLRKKCFLRARARWPLPRTRHAHVPCARPAQVCSVRGEAATARGVQRSRSLSLSLSLSLSSLLLPHPFSLDSSSSGRGAMTPSDTRPLQVRLLRRRRSRHPPPPQAPRQRLLQVEQAAAADATRPQGAGKEGLRDALQRAVGGAIVRPTFGTCSTVTVAATSMSPAAAAENVLAAVDAVPSRLASSPPSLSPSLLSAASLPARHVVLPAAAVSPRPSRPLSEPSLPPPPFLRRRLPRCCRASGATSRRCTCAAPPNSVALPIYLQLAPMQ